MVWLYLSLKALHIIAIVAWMAGLLYLYRLFVYHVEESEPVVKARFQIMERRLYRIITLPPMEVAVVLGASLLAIQVDYLRMGWMHLKLLAVAGMIAMTLFGGRQIEELAAGRQPFASRTYRILNEVPTLLLVLIVFLVILKPF